MGSLYEEVGARIAELRRTNGWTQEQLAEKVDRNASYLARIEAGKRKATLDTLALIAAALGVPVRALLPDVELPELPRALVVELARLPPKDLQLLTLVARRFGQPKASVKGRR